MHTSINKTIISSASMVVVIVFLTSTYFPHGKGINSISSNWAVSKSNGAENSEITINDISENTVFLPIVLSTAASKATRRVNVPYLQELPFEPAIFWFGQVNPDTNYADVRSWYYDETLQIVMHIIDRLHWTDPAYKTSDLTNWDSVSIYINTSGNVGSTPTTNSYRFDVQLGDLKAAYRGNGNTWVPTPLSFAVTTIWRGDQGPNSGVDGKGWQADFSIPFSSLGYISTPPTGTIWGLGIIQHDRDDATEANISHTQWPENLDPSSPSTWGQLHFGRASYQAPVGLPQGEQLIRQDKDGISVMDAAAGGHTTCGDGIDHWSEWGNTNYQGYSQFNIQNQWDISEWPCFSKYYVTFPLDTVPAGKLIFSASLTLTLFGNAGECKDCEPPLDSYIEVLTVGENWSEMTLTWNNAPIPVENISGTWVKPRDYSVPDQPYHWDVSKAVYQAYTAGQPLRLAVYSIDGEMHSGKYFWTSDADDGSTQVRPALRVIWGDACDPNEC